MIEVLKQALEALETYGDKHRKTYLLEGAWDEEITKGDAAIKAGKQAIAEFDSHTLYREGYVNGYAFGEAAGKHQAIAELESQEPVAWMRDIGTGTRFLSHGTKGIHPDGGWKPLYTHPPKSFTYEQVKAHIRAASMSANDIVVGSDVTNDGVSVVIRRRDEILYAEFFAHPPQREWVGLTDERREQLIQKCWREYIAGKEDGTTFGEWMSVATEAELKEKNT